MPEPNERSSRNASRRCLRRSTIRGLVGVLGLCVATAGIASGATGTSWPEPPGPEPTEPRANASSYAEANSPATLAENGVTTIAECTNIRDPGHYRLTDDILDRDRDFCITIWTSDVVLDGAGHRVDGVDRHRLHDDDGTTKGIRVRSENGGKISNVTVRNVVATDWGQGLFVARTVDSRVVDVTARSNGQYGIYVGYGAYDVTFVRNRVVDNRIEGIAVANHADGNVIRDTLARNNSRGIVVAGVNETLVVDNEVVNNSVGVSLGAGDDNEVRNNVISRNRIGIRPSGTTATAIVGNVLRDNEQFGVFTRGGNADAVIRDNEITGSGQGIRLLDTRGTRIADNTITDNRIGTLVRDGGGTTMHGNRWNNIEWDIKSLELSSPITVENARLGDGVRVSFTGRNVAVAGSASVPAALPADTRPVGNYLDVSPDSGPSWIDVTISFDPTAVEDPSSLDLWVHDGTWGKPAESAVDREPDAISTNVTDMDGVTVFAILTTVESTPDPTETDSPTTSPGPDETDSTTSTSPGPDDTDATTASPGPTDTDSPTDDPATPGYGMGVALLALLVGVWIGRRYR